MYSVDIIKSVSGLIRHMKDDMLKISNALIDINGENEVDVKEVICRKIYFKGKKATWKLKNKKEKVVS